MNKRFKTKIVKNWSEITKNDQKLVTNWPKNEQKWRKTVKWLKSA